MDNLDQTKRELMDEVKGKLIEELNLEEITPEDIDNEAPLFGDEGLGLDSIDALEIILILEREYGIKIEHHSEGKQIFYSVRTLADYIIAYRIASPSNIIVTGLGVVPGIGIVVSENIEAVRQRKHGIGKITLFPTALDVPVS